MSVVYTLLLFAHLVAVIVWVGGMFLMHFAVRPAAVEVLQPPQRLPLLAGVLRRFFVWVALAVVVVLASGFSMISIAGGMANAHPSVHWMSTLGLVMAAIFVVIVALPFRRLQSAVSAGEWPDAGAQLLRIRWLVAINLILGLVTTAVATVGRALL
jgi:uncharacterized membrane protein